jgi:ribosomal protein S20
MPKNWKELVTTSHLETVKAIQHELEAGNLEEAEAGLNELASVMDRAERNAVDS